MSIILPKNPNPDQHEDFVAAALIAFGNFIETNITLRDSGSEILELDIIATPTGPEFKNRRLYEVKTSGWSFADLFKVYGWMTYLGIQHGCITYRDGVDDARKEAFQKIADETSVRCCRVTVDTLEDLVDAPAELPENVFLPVFFTAFYSRMAQRICLRKFIDHSKSHKNSESLRGARAYYWALQQACFAKTPIRRVHILYDAFHEHHHLSGTLVQEKASDKGVNDSEIWDGIRDQSKYLWLQFVMIMEHTARIRIIKNALDHVHARETEDDPAAKRLKPSAILETLAPETFRAGLKVLRTHPHRERIPFLFQVFVEVFGGYYRCDSTDVADLGEITGIPEKDVVDCLNLFDQFFPVNNGWFFETKGELRVMKMIPGVFRGAGAFYRQDRHSLKSYREFFPKMGWLVSKWHDALYECLEPALGDKKQ